ncbi:MAG: c-type cytochrome [Putridiphycobacter sp.]
MKKRFLKFGLLILCIGGILAFNFQQPNYTFTQMNDQALADLSVQEVLIELGDDKPIHYLSVPNSDSVQMGYEMVHFGQLKDKSNKRISKFFVCTDCHNQVKEVSDLSKATAADRLDYGIKNNLPFLPASTFYGQYNKTHWYNGDYAKKYGDLVIPTRDTLLNAIQLCAVQCSQGRPMEHWELRAMLHYFRSIDYKIKDLNFTPNELAEIKSNLGTKAPQTVKMIKSKYNPINPATFGDPYQHFDDLSGGNIKTGAYIFNKGCLHCHQLGKNITVFEFDADNLTFSFLNHNLKKHTNYSVPYIVRKGTYATSGKRQYMPQYPLEKMSNQQLIDLMAFIQSKSK